MWQPVSFFPINLWCFKVLQKVSQVITRVLQPILKVEEQAIRWHFELDVSQKNLQVIKNNWQKNFSHSRSCLCQRAWRVAWCFETRNFAIKMWSRIITASWSLSLDIQFIRRTNGANIAIANNWIGLVSIKLHSDIRFGLWNNFVLGSKCHRITKISMRVSNCCGRWATKNSSLTFKFAFNLI